MIPGAKTGDESTAAAAAGDRTRAVLEP